MINERVIKFRAWHNGIICHPKTKNIPAKMLYDEKPGDCLRWARDQDIAQVMQFTGFKDTNGKEIYEGDILNEKEPIFDNGYWEVRWNGTVGMWGAYYNKWSATHSLSHLLEMRQYFIAGNIFDGCAGTLEPGVSCPPQSITPG